MYVKLFGAILDSSLWLQPDHVRIVWITLLVSMDEDGYAHFAAPANLARRAGVSLEQARDAIQYLEGPDPDSSNPENDGRRVDRVPGGWLVLNSREYRERATKVDARNANRERQARFRLRNAQVTPPNGASHPVTPSDADADDPPPSPPGHRGTTEVEAPAQEARPETAPDWEAIRSEWNGLAAVEGLLLVDRPFERYLRRHWLLRVAEHGPDFWERVRVELARRGAWAREFPAYRKFSWIVSRRGAARLLSGELRDPPSAAELEVTAAKEREGRRKHAEGARKILTAEQLAKRLEDFRARHRERAPAMTNGLG